MMPFWNSEVRLTKKYDFVSFASWYLAMPYETEKEIEKELSDDEYKRVRKRYEDYLKSKFSDPADFIDFG